MSQIKDKIHLKTKFNINIQKAKGE